MNPIRLIVNAVLILIAALVAYMLVQTIRRPIEFRDTLASREKAVRDKLTNIAHLQKMHKDLTGKFASTFDSLKLVLTTGTFRIERVQGDKYDSTQVVTVDTVDVPAIDTLRNYLKKEGKTTDIDAFFADVSKVPFNDTAHFRIKTGIAAVEGMDSLMSPAFEVLTLVGTYMYDFPQADYQIYNPDFKHDNVRKVGDINKPNKLSGNW